MKKNIMISITLIFVIGLVVYWNLPKDQEEEVSSVVSLSINEQAIKLIEEGKYIDSYFMLFDDLSINYNLDNMKKENLSSEKRKEYNLFLYSSAKNDESENRYIPALQYFKKLEPIDGIVTQDEINETIAYLTPKAEIAKKEIEAEKNIKVNPSIGMTKDDVRNSTWGKPKYTNKTTTANGVHEQWVYVGNRYLYFDNGILTTIQD